MRHLTSPDGHPDSPPPANSAVTLLPLPKVSTLSSLQKQGTICVWGCGATLTSGTALNLGARPDGAGAQFFPRGCADCARTAARRVCAVHERTCPRCRMDPTVCADRRALRRLALEGRR